MILTLLYKYKRTNTDTAILPGKETVKKGTYSNVRKEMRGDASSETRSDEYVAASSKLLGDAYTAQLATSSQATVSSAQAESDAYGAVSSEIIACAADAYATSTCQPPNVSSAYNAAPHSTTSQAEVHTRGLTGRGSYATAATAGYTAYDARARAISSTARHPFAQEADAQAAAAYAQAPRVKPILRNKVCLV